ncbi:hypothetical protein SGGMMB4_03847 [Sodalis glossinidius str. 'morsitans']|uniref:Uncharacterized protein n=1 Tax=Sodalis glossinidius (strain morsitans) TaxID=343509 RepID=A0A193QKS1_SODGM|nr:hypothetical protein SGGMMB4_03847 [Sodalis glossinidius str. 'morsitans']
MMKDTGPYALIPEGSNRVEILLSPAMTINAKATTPLGTTRTHFVSPACTTTQKLGFFMMSQNSGSLTVVPYQAASDTAAAIALSTISR